MKARWAVIVWGGGAPDAPPKRQVQSPGESAEAQVVWIDRFRDLRCVWGLCLFNEAALLA